MELNRGKEEEKIQEKTKQLQHIHNNHCRKTTKSILKQNNAKKTFPFINSGTLPRECVKYP